ncbi:MAG: chorismate synthase [Rhodothermales bacterium]|nr:chorismate synthase [Rhodothermales bacterium]
MIRYLTAGESHGEALIGIVEGMPAGVAVSPEAINEHLARRWLGFGRGGRAKIERDSVHIISGVRFGKTMGSPVALRLDNAAYHKDRSNWEFVMAVGGSGDDVDPVTLPRPGHADLVGTQKYRFDDIRPVIERASARETAMRVACCTLARPLLEAVGIEVGSHVTGIGRVRYSTAATYLSRQSELLTNGAGSLNKAADQSDVRMIDPDLSARCIEHIIETKKSGDSLGGSYEVVVTGVPPGLGSYVHWDRRLDGQLAQAVMSIQGQKAVEVGDGIAGSFAPGSEVHDEIVAVSDELRRRTNRAGGIEGGVSNGMPIVVRGYMKPIPTLIKPLNTVDIASGVPQPTRYERSDVTSVPAASTVAEATVALVIANAVLEKYGGDSLAELRARFP